VSKVVGLSAHGQITSSRTKASPSKWKINLRHCPMGYGSKNRRITINQNLYIAPTLNLSRKWFLLFVEMME